MARSSMIVPLINRHFSSTRPLRAHWLLPRVTGKYDNAAQYIVRVYESRGNELLPYYEHGAVVDSSDNSIYLDVEATIASYPAISQTSLDTRRPTSFRLVITAPRIFYFGTSSPKLSSRSLVVASGQKKEAKEAIYKSEEFVVDSETSKHDDNHVPFVDGETAAETEERRQQSENASFKKTFTPTSVPSSQLCSG
ncbi:Uu.00g109520.m01.CDS01 [Anthostomella pinea]|uniref:Uu.00g109520.m01.CDS01 n=1 Tax=Anthostomella pinea TaxID=933095 RepID=A0AAI8VEN8_9PEZI|nr:Uu.00g109520.m01.CDS01 [Anthostomella pinea]